jgi:hypothetical protein
MLLHALLRLAASSAFVWLFVMPAMSALAGDPLPPLQAGVNGLARLPAVESPQSFAESAPTPLPPFSAEQKSELDRRIAEYIAGHPPLRPGLQFGYDLGFIIASPEATRSDERNSPFFMRINSWVQMRHTLLDSDGPNPDENNFELERVRLTFGGHAYTPDLTYFLQLDGDSDDAEFVDLLDYVVSYDVGHDRLGWQQGRLGIRAGKWKLPFNRARWESGNRLMFVDRSPTTIVFDINRSLGAGLYGQLDVLDKPVNWEVAFFNGLNASGARPSRTGDLDRNPAFSTRVYADVIGDWGPDGESDLNYHEQPAMRVGMGIAVTRVDKEGAREFARQRVVDSGAPLADLLPQAVSAYDVAFYTADMSVKYRGLTLIGDVYFRRLSRFSGAPVDDLLDHGVMLQTGYFIVPRSIELLARWSSVVGDSGTLGLTDRSADEIAGGITWFIRGHDAKITFDATHLNGAPIRDTALNILPGDSGWLYRTQFQLRF